jgi:mannose-1-phosphate guanylyltransferase
MAKAQRFALITAGGRGTRFWPRSRKAHPKQVLSIAGDDTLIQQTVARITRLLPPENVYVVTSEAMRPVMARQLPQVPSEQIIAEPLPRNTAPCIALGAHIIWQRDPRAVMGVFHADHAIERPQVFLKAVRAAFQAADSESLVVVGVPPRWAETGYGYLEFPKGAVPGNVYPLRSFREKPGAATARRYLKAGNYFWNSGMFFWRAETFLDALNQHLPHTALQIESISRFGSRNFERDLAEFFPMCESVSVDHGIMERSRNVLGIAADDFGWSDVGSWQAVYELCRKDAEANAVRGSDLFSIASRGNFVDAAGKVVALLGVENLVIVDTKDALLVARRDDAHRVGEMVKLLEKRNREDLL